MQRGHAKDRRLRVVYLDHVAKLSGGELALLRTLPALAQHVDAVVVLAEDGPLRDRVEALGIEVRILPLGDRVRDARRETMVAGGVSAGQVLALARYIRQLRALLREIEPDIVHTNSLKSAVYGGVAGRLSRIPVLWHVRDRIAADYLPRPAVFAVRLAARVLPTAVVANSQTTLNTLPRRGVVLGNPVVPDAVERPTLPERDGDRPLTIGLVGRLSPWKGQDVFLKAFASAFPDGDERAHLVGSAMFGEEAWEHRLHELADTLGIAERVEFRGFREDIWAEYAQIDIAVHASTTPEPFGQVVLEAMAAGVPLIAADEGGPAEVVLDGVDGLLVQPRAVEPLAEALTRLSRDGDLRQSLVRAGKETAARYQPERTALGLVSVYRTLI
jgi:glycosyltransferase involved in cell wall biosynthesis